MDKRRFFIRKIKPYGFVKSPSGVPYACGI